MDKSPDLRKILSQNIRNARASLHISQAKLAEFAGISVSYMVDIEYCKTWVSDKTLVNIARALNMPPHELLVPPEGEKSAPAEKGDKRLKRTADIIKAQKSQMRKLTGELMDNLLLEILRIHGE